MADIQHQMKERVRAQSEKIDRVRAEIARVPLDEDKLKRDLDIDALFGEPGYGTLEREWVRPTLEVNGITGGFQGQGGKTIVPSWAVAKITCRLVQGQDPADVADKLSKHILAAAPEGVSVNVRKLPGNGRAYQMPLDLEVLELAGDAMEATFGKRPFPVWTGGTVPVAEQFVSELGIWCLYFAFSEPDNGPLTDTRHGCSHDAGASNRREPRGTSTPGCHDGRPGVHGAARFGIEDRHRAIRRRRQAALDPARGYRRARSLAEVVDARGV